MPEYCIYLRKSRADFEAEQHGSGETLATHKKTLLALAKKLNLSVTEIYQEIVSGDTIAARPEMQRLLEDVNSGRWDGVLVMEVERLARGDTMDQGLVAQSFKYSGTKIITPLKIYDPTNEFDEEYFEFGLFMSRREYKTINRRLQRGREAAARAGKWQSQAPYGYKKKKIEHDKGWTLEIDSERAEHVRMMFEWYVIGAEIDGEIRRLGIQSIARRLNEMGIPSYRHDYWQKETVRDIISNPAYCGLVRWGYRKTDKRMVNGKPVKSRPITNDECIIAEGLHEGIVPREMFDKAQEILNSQAKIPLRLDKSIQSPLSGLVTCGKCGRKMVLRKGSNGKPDYLVCHARSCNVVSTRMDLVERRVLSILEEWVTEFNLTSHTTDKRAERSSALHEQVIKSLENDIATLEKQQKTSYTLVEQGIYTPEVFLERSKEISSELEQKKAAIAENKKALARIKKNSVARVFFIPKVQHVLDVYYDMETPTDKNVLLKEIIEYAVYDKDHSGAFSNHSADEFKLELFPLIPFKDD